MAAARVYNAQKDDKRVSREPTGADNGNKPANAQEAVVLDVNLDNFRNVARQRSSPFFAGKIQ